jgi:cell division protein FtsB
MGGKIRWIIILVSMFMIISLSRSVVDLWERRKILEVEQKRLTQLEQKHKELEQKLRMVQTPAFVEKEARERLGMAKEGDTVIIMGNSSLPQDTGKESQLDNSPILPYWKRWWRIFFEY